MKPADVGKLKLPTSFRINADVLLPNSVPIEYLCERKKSKSKPVPRKKLISWLASAVANQDLFASKETVTQQAAKLAQELRPASVEESEASYYERQLELAKALLVDVAGRAVGGRAELPRSRCGTGRTPTTRLGSAAAAWLTSWATSSATCRTSPRRRTRSSSWTNRTPTCPPAASRTC